MDFEVVIPPPLLQGCEVGEDDISCRHRQPLLEGGEENLSLPSLRPPLQTIPWLPH